MTRNVFERLGIKKKVLAMIPEKDKVNSSMENTYFYTKGYDLAIGKHNDVIVMSCHDDSFYDLEFIKKLVKCDAVRNFKSSPGSIVNMDFDGIIIYKSSGSDDWADEPFTLSELKEFYSKND